jgi:hypothetical protein
MRPSHIAAQGAAAAYFSRAANGQASIVVPNCAPSISTQGLEGSTRMPYRASNCSRTGCVARPDLQMGNSHL